MAHSASDCWRSIRKSAPYFNTSYIARINTTNQACLFRTFQPILQQQSGIKRERHHFVTTPKAVPTAPRNLVANVAPSTLATQVRSVSSPAPRP